MKTLLMTLVIATGAWAFDVPNADGPSFDAEIRPVFKNRCAKCHNENNSLPNVLDYKTAYSLRKEIQSRVVLERSMPLYGNIKESERDLIKRWIDSGAKV